MGTTGALLSDVQALVEEDDMIRTGIDAAGADRALYRVDDDQAILSLVNRLLDGAGVHAGSLITVHAEVRTVSHFDFGHRPSHSFSKLKPKLPGIGLRLGNGCPIIGHMFILADDLTGMTTVALGYVDDEDFLGHRLSSRYSKGPLGVLENLYSGTSKCFATQFPSILPKTSCATSHVTHKTWQQPAL